ncbi:MAG: hypothetical protein AB7O52_01005 [Planctomycetota bacterium]
MFTISRQRTRELERASAVGGRVILVVLLASVGCSSLDSASRDAMRRARTIVQNEPAAALAEAQSVLQRHPSHVGARRLAALALEGLGQMDAASREWELVLANDDSDEDDLWAAHLGRLRTLDSMLGPIPDQVTAISAQAPPLLPALASCDALLMRKSHSRELRIKRGELLYRLGRHLEGAEQFDSLLRDDPNDPLVGYLRALITEHQRGIDDLAIRRFCDLANCDDESIRTLAAAHLIFLVDESDLDDITRDNVRGNLVRMARTEESSPRIRSWVLENERRSAANWSERQIARQIRDVAAAREHGQWDHAWSLLQALPPELPTVALERRAVATAWVSALVETGVGLLAQGNTAGARESADQLLRITGESLPPELVEQVRAFTEDLAMTEARSRLASELTQVEQALEKQDARAALTLLDGIDDVTGIPTALGRQIREMRAEALFLAQQPAESLSLLDGLRPLTQPRLQRIHGILLARAGRSDEALTVLEGLPLGHLAGSALEAYLQALEQQKNWDAILARMLILDPVPDEFRAIRRRACFEAANIRLRRRNPQAALDLLSAHLDGNELGLPPVHEVYLQCLLKTGQIEQIYELIQLQGVDRVPQVSFGLATDIASKVAPLFADADAFVLLKNLETNNPGSATEQLMPLWARFGSYLPAPGNYSRSYRVTEMDSQGRTQDTRTIEQSLHWSSGGFEVTEQNLPGSERWEVRDDVWVRKTRRGEERIPTRVAGPPPYAPLTYKLGDGDWSAEVIETNANVTIESKRYSGCIRVRLTSSLLPQEVTLLTLAPEVGEVKREIQQLGTTSLVRELLRSTAETPTETP